MRCQHVDDDIQCRLDATRRVLIGGGDPPDPDQSGFAVTIHMVLVCKEHDPRPGGRCRCRAILTLFRSANVRGGRSYPAMNPSRPGTAIQPTSAPAAPQSGRL
jgi:hypothetical protein